MRNRLDAHGIIVHIHSVAAGLLAFPNIVQKQLDHLDILKTIVST